MRRVGVVGAAGKMGTEAAVAIAEADDLELTALVDPTRGAVHASAAWASSLDEVDPTSVDLIVDLSVADVARRTLAWVVAHDKDAVVGTSGLTEADINDVRVAAAGHRSRILIVPNFSIGAVLVQRFAALAAPHFESVEIVELHHDQKRDAPSATSIATAGSVAAARAAHGLAAPKDPTESSTIEGARGAVGPGGVHLHSVRLPGLLAHQEVLFGGPGEGLVLRHDTFSRASFMVGLLTAVRGIDAVNGVDVGLHAVLDT